jgi:hypothetical protein
MYFVDLRIVVDSDATCPRNLLSESSAAIVRDFAAIQALDVL